MRNALLILLGLPASLMILFIKLYQRTLSPDHGLLRHFYPHGFCRHEPTCSEYAIEVLRTRALPIAIVAIVGRIFQCNPYGKTTPERLLRIIDLS